MPPVFQYFLTRGRSTARAASYAPLLGFLLLPLLLAAAIRPADPPKPYSPHPPPVRDAESPFAEATPTIAAPEAPAQRSSGWQAWVARIGMAAIPAISMMAALLALRLIQRFRR